MDDAEKHFECEKRARKSRARQEFIAPNFHARGEAPLVCTAWAGNNCPSWAGRGVPSTPERKKNVKRGKRAERLVGGRRRKNSDESQNASSLSRSLPLTRPRPLPQTARRKSSDASTALRPGRASRPSARRRGGPGRKSTTSTPTTPTRAS